MRMAVQLSAADGQSGLRFLTALCWGDAIASHALVRRQRAWWPAVLRGVACSGAAFIWEPLLWALHRPSVSVYVTAASCGALPLVWTAVSSAHSRSRPGYCYFCQQWLGDRSSRSPHRPCSAVLTRRSCSLGDRDNRGVRADCPLACPRTFTSGAARELTYLYTAGERGRLHVFGSPRPCGADQRVLLEWPAKRCRGSTCAADLLPPGTAPAHVSVDTPGDLYGRLGSGQRHGATDPVARCGTVPAAAWAAGARSGPAKQHTAIRSSDRTPSGVPQPRSAPSP